MPPRTTEESYRLPVSDRTMVSTLATDMLASFGNRKAPAFSSPLLPNPIDNPPHSLGISYLTFCPWPKLGCVREIFLPKLGRSTVA
jgi:hypothetical protein